MDLSVIGPVALLDIGVASMSEDHAPHPPVGTCAPEHTLQPVPKAVEGVVFGFHQPRLPQILVDRRREGGGLVVITWEAVRETLHRLQTDPEQRDLPHRVARLGATVRGTDADVGDVVGQLDVLGAQSAEFARACSGVDHGEQDSPGLVVEPVQRLGGKQLLLDPIGGKLGACFGFGLGEFDRLAPERRGKRQGQRIDHGLDDGLEVREILVRGVGLQVLLLNLRQPPRPKLDQIRAGQVGQRDIPHDRDEVPKRLVAGIAILAQLVRGHLERLDRLDRFAKLCQRLAQRHLRWLGHTKQGVRHDLVRLSHALRDAIDALDLVLHRHRHDLLERLVAIAVLRADIQSRVISCAGVGGIAPQSCLPCHQQGVPSRFGFGLGLDPAVRPQAQRYLPPLFGNPRITLRNPPNKVPHASPHHQHH